MQNTLNNLEMATQFMLHNHRVACNMR